MQSREPDQNQNELNLLQALLVEPELKKLRYQVTELTQKISTLEQKVERLETSQREDFDSINHLLDQKLSALRQEMLQTLPALIDDAIEEQIDPGQTFSIKVVGLEHKD